MRITYLGDKVGADAAREVLPESVEIIHPVAEPAPVAEALAQSHALLDASMKVKITDQMVAAAPDLKIISCATTGSDHIERGELDKRDIPVRTLKEDRELLLNITPAAELSFTLLMACARRLVAAAESVKAGNWTRENFPGIMLQGKRLGVIGCGRLGTWMSRYAQAFRMETIGYDPFLKDFPETITPASLEKVVTTSDFISVHVHLSEDTKGLVSRELLSRVKQGAILINTSRGAIVDEAALIDALKEGRMAGAGLDVLSDEPELEKSALHAFAKEHDNVIITPHCGGFSPDAVAVVCAHAAKKIRERLAV